MRVGKIASHAFARRTNAARDCFQTTFFIGAGIDRTACVSQELAERVHAAHMSRALASARLRFGL
jgi:hypothetical protein